MSAVAPDNTEVQLYLDPDRSMAQRRTAWHLSQARKIPAQRHPSLSVAAARADGALTYQRRPIFECAFVDADRTVRWKWIDDTLNTIGVDASELKTALAEHIDEANADYRRKRG